MSETLLKIENLSKSYGATKAVQNVSFSLNSGGGIYGLLGPNGAGKSTLIHCLLDLIPINSGKIEISGIDHRQCSARQSIAHLPEKFSFYKYYRVRDVLDFYASAYNCELNQELLESLELTDIFHKKVRELSKGQLQRTALGGLLSGGAALTILDEPFSGVDPLGISKLKKILEAEAQRGRTFLISSHLLGEMEKLVGHAIIFHRGSLQGIYSESEFMAAGGLDVHFEKVVEGASL